MLCLSFPLAARAAERRSLLPTWLSGIIACYLVGIVVTNLRIWPIDGALLEQIAGLSMLVGLPLLLFSVRIKEALRYAGPMLLGFGLCCVSGLLCTGVVGYTMAGSVPDAWKVAGMLVGLYTGGTPNVQSIGLALDAPAGYLVLVQASDVLLGGAYLLGLITFLPALYAKFFRVDDMDGPAQEVETEADRSEVIVIRPGRQLAAAVVVIAAATGCTYLLVGGLGNLTVVILLLTSFALLASTLPTVRNLGDPYPLGEYFILVFSVALGLLADFRELAENGKDLLWFSFLALSSTTALHLLASRLFDLDRDTVILSSVAGFYGPVFVVQVAAALGRRKLMAAGIAVSLFGFGIGNYLGIALAYLLFWLIS